MALLQQILVATDFSPCSSHALAEARQFATVFGASMDLLHVWSMPPLVAPESVITGMGNNEQPLLEWMRKSAALQLEKFEAEARSAGIAIRGSRCLGGDPASTIVEQAVSGKYDLLVLGTHGRSGLSHLLMGSVAEKVVRRSPCAVLTVREAQ